MRQGVRCPQAMLGLLLLLLLLVVLVVVCWERRRCLQVQLPALCSSPKCTAELDRVTAKRMCRSGVPPGQLPPGGLMRMAWSALLCTAM